jgi:PAS domain S-box-containing protein
MSDHSAHPHESLLTGDRLRRSVSILFATIFVGLVVLQIAHVGEQHNKIISESQDRAESLAHVLSEHLVQKIASFDAALSQIALHSERVGGPTAQPDLWAPTLRAALAGLTAAGSISITNDSGMIVHSTIAGIVGQSRSDSYIFRHLKENPAAEFAVDTPYYSPLRKLMLIPFGRRLLSPEGEFAGVAVVTLMPEQLRRFYRAVDLGNGGRISVLHTEGVILFSEPSNGDVTGNPAPKNPLFEAASQGAGNGFLRAPLESGGRSYLSAYRTVRKANVILGVSIGEDRVFGPLLTDILIALGLSAVLGGVLLFAGYLINREIRARAFADAALKVQEARFQEIMYHAPVFVSVKDTQGNVEFINKALEDFFGRSKEQVKGKKLEEIVSAGTGPGRLIASLDQEVIDTKTPLQRELSYPTMSGTRTALFVKFPLLDMDGNVLSVASFSVDLTEQRRAAAWFRTVMDHAPALIAMKDIEGRFVFVNRAQETASGIKISEFLGRKSRELFPAEYAEVHDQFDSEVLAARAPVQREFTAPYLAGTRTLLFVKFPVFDAKGNIEFLGSIATDITSQ